MARQSCPGHEDLISQSWARDELVAMDAAFIAAMQAAGHALTAPSTAFGTRAPIQGYRRKDT